MNSKFIAAVVITVAATTGGTVIATGTADALPQVVVQAPYGSQDVPNLDGSQRLDITFSRNTPPRSWTLRQWRANWGSDSTLGWAHRMCKWMGGRTVWHDGIWLDCQDVDY